MPDSFQDEDSKRWTMHLGKMADGRNRYDFWRRALPGDKPMSLSEAEEEGSATIMAALKELGAEIGDIIAGPYSCYWPLTICGIHFSLVCDDWLFLCANSHHNDRAVGVLADELLKELLRRDRAQSPE